VDDQPSAKQNQGNTDETITQPTPQKLINPIEAPEKRQETAQSNTEKNPLRDRPKWTDVAIVILTAGICYFAYVQSREMVNTGIQTDKIIAADERLATAMENSVKEASNSLKATIDQSHLDQRAWVGPIEATPVQDLKVGGRPIFGVVVTNSGKTPALNLQHMLRTDVYKKGATFRPTYPSPSIERSISVLQPGMRITFVTNAVEGPVTQANIDTLKSGAYVIKYYGRMSYDDVFGGHHMTTFCLYIAPNLTGVSSCDSYNQAN
jgi:hypothetical protein